MSREGLNDEFDPDVAARTIPPLGSGEAPERWLMNHLTRARSWAWMSSNAALR